MVTSIREHEHVINVITNKCVRCGRGDTEIMFWQLPCGPREVEGVRERVRRRLALVAGSWRAVFRGAQGARD